jgi:transposase
MTAMAAKMRVAGHQGPASPPDTRVLRMAREYRSWSYDRMAGALKHLGYTINAQTVGNILKRHGIPPASKRQETTAWKEFIRTRMDVLVATVSSPPRSGRRVAW